MSVSRIARGMRLFECYVGQRTALGHPVSQGKSSWSGSPPWVRDVWIAVGEVDQADSLRVADLHDRLTRTQGERDHAQKVLADSELERVKLRNDRDALSNQLDVRIAELNRANEQAAMSDRALAMVTDRSAAPIAMHLWCPSCGTQHLDVGDFATRPHKTHTCQGCGFCWMPCLQPTVGVRFLPGTENATPLPEGHHRVTRTGHVTMGDGQVTDHFKLEDGTSLTIHYKLEKP